MKIASLVFIFLLLGCENRAQKVESTSQEQLPQSVHEQGHIKTH